MLNNQKTRPGLPVTILNRSSEQVVKRRSEWCSEQNIWWSLSIINQEQKDSPLKRAQQIMAWHSTRFSVTFLGALLLCLPVEGDVNLELSTTSGSLSQTVNFLDFLAMK